VVTWTPEQQPQVSEASSYWNRLAEVWEAHPPAARMRRKQASRPDSPSTFVRRRAVELVPSARRPPSAVVAVSTAAKISESTVELSETTATDPVAEFVVEFVVAEGTVTAVGVFVAAIFSAVGEFVAAISSAGSATTLQTLLSKRTSTFGGASPPSAHLLRTSAGIGHSGMFDRHACAWELVPRGHRPPPKRS